MNKLKISNGYVLWSGRSPEDQKPIMVVATGFLRPSANIKTGPMIQVSVMRADMPPNKAIRSGEDRSVCNDCSLRPSLVQALEIEPGEQRPPQCYVRGNQGLWQKWNHATNGGYPQIPRKDLARITKEVFSGRKVRIGEYGNFSNVPLEVTQSITDAARGHTLYEHNWQVDHSQGLAQLAMASVSSVEAKEEANANGWLTYRVKRPDEPRLKDEVTCPASREAGYKKICYECLLCCGRSQYNRQNKKQWNVVINDHGPTSKRKPELIQVGVIKR